MPNKTENELPVITEVSDGDIVKYLSKEIGKTRSEIVTEIRERFWTYNELETFFNKP